MRRYEATQRVMEAITDQLVVCNIGHPSQELFQIRDRPENFYMLGSMGLSSSIGLGVAMSQHKTVIALDGDGSVTMNMGTLATVGRVRPANYVLIIIDNETYGSTGFQESFTARGLRLDEVARGCGIEHVSLITEEHAVKPTLEAALEAGDGPYVMIIKTEPGMPDNIGIIPVDGLSIRDRFMAAARSD